MVYLCEKGSEEKKKTCNDCQTTKTPLWRKGPAGPKSLCNACGIKHRKKRRALIGINKGGSTIEKKLSIDKKSLIEKKSRLSHSDNKINKNKQDSKLTVSSKLRLLTLGREVMMQRCSIEKQRMNLGEEEQAAVLLMALSCGSVYG